MITLSTQRQRMALKQALVLLQHAFDTSAIAEDAKAKVESALAIALGSFRR